MRNVNFSKYLGEGLLIVFSVLFALFINRWAENRQTEERKDIAIEGIRQELYRNSGIIKDWTFTHSKIVERLENILNGNDDSLKTTLAGKDYLDLDILIQEETLFNAILSDTAWESAKSTGIMSEFDFRLTQELTRTYTMQEVFSDRTIMNLIDLFFDRDIHDMDNLEGNLRALSMRMAELHAQEKTLQHFYTESIKALNQ